MHYIFAAIIIISGYLMQNMMRTESIEGYTFSKDFNNLTCYYDWNYQINQWIPKDVVKIILVVVITSLFLKLKRKGNRLSPYEKKRNLGVVRGSVILPWRLPIIDEIYGLIYARLVGVKTLEDLVRKFGNLFEIQFGPMYLTVVSNPDVLQKVLSSTQPQHLSRPSIYRRMFYDAFRDGLVTSDHEAWSGQRKRLSRCFTYGSLQQYLKFINTYAKNLAKNVISSGDDKSCVEGKALQTLIYRHAFRVVSQILFGMDQFDDDENAELSDNFCRFKDLMVDRLVNPLSLGHYLWFHPKKREFDRIKNYLENFETKNLQIHKKEMEKSLKTVDTEEYKLSDLQTNINPFRCMVDELLARGASDQEICDQIVTIAGTGHESSVVAIQMLLMNLATNPETQAICRKEVDTLFDKKIFYKGGNSFDCELSMEDILNLKYLDMCILESGRLHSTLPIFLRRLDAPVKISDEIVLGAGTNLGISLWTLHRDPKHFPNPEKFDPDRFLCENVKKRHPYAYIPFSAGKRDCIGSKVAHLQIKVFMAWLIRNFEILSTDKLEDVKLQIGFTIVPERPFNIIFKRRATK